MNIPAKSEEVTELNHLFSGLQVYVVSKLNALSLTLGKGKACKADSWECDRGKHGGGKQYKTRDLSLFNQASVLFSEIHFEDKEHIALESVSEFSTTIHPDNPHIPSFHLSVSWEKMKEEKGCWTLITDLNPSILNEADLDKTIFSETVKKAAGTYYEEAVLQGDKCFYIPQVQRERGVFHYCLENYMYGNFEEEKAFVLTFCEEVIQCYLSIFTAKQALHANDSEEKKDEQLAYHTLYTFQLLTLDRHTASSLLLQDQNDVGILDGLPSYIDRDILTSWLDKMSKPQDALLKQILQVLPKSVPTLLDEKSKKALASTIRKHYKKYPEALKTLGSYESTIG